MRLALTLNDPPAAVIVCKETLQMPPRAQMLLSDFDPRGQEVNFRNDGWDIYRKLFYSSGLF